MTNSPLMTLEDFETAFAAAFAAATDPSAMLVRADAKALGMVTSHTVRVSPRWTATASRCIGTGCDDDGKAVFTEDGAATVRLRDLFDPSIDYFVPASSYRVSRRDGKRSKRSEAFASVEVSTDARIDHAAAMRAVGAVHGHNFTEG